MVSFFRLISIQIMLLGLPLAITAQEKSSNELAEAFILKVVRSYKNPWAYYPYSKDIFLPTEEEVMKLERENSYPNGARVMGSFIFLKKGSDYKREPFVDAKGNRMFVNFLRPRKRVLSLKGDAAYYQKKQRLLNGNSNVGRFLLFNETFKKD